jgi:hypothetical protein
MIQSCGPKRNIIRQFNDGLGMQMFTAFTVHVCQLLEGHLRPGDKRASLAVCTTEQEVHERPALNPQFIHAHETPFARSVANQRAVLHIHLAKLCPKQERFTRVHRMPFVPHVPGLSHTHGDRAVAFADHEPTRYG